jgi:hypothetical protein
VGHHGGSHAQIVSGQARAERMVGLLPSSMSRFPPRRSCATLAKMQATVGMPHSSTNGGP